MSTRSGAVREQRNPRWREAVAKATAMQVKADESPRHKIERMHRRMKTLNLRKPIAS